MEKKSSLIGMDNGSMSDKTKREKQARVIKLNNIHGCWETEELRIVNNNY